jgi:glycosyltransferase involved in cell wall biosynthesis
MKLAITGFVCEKLGSLSSSNSLVLKELLKQGHQIHFFSKSSFVDPRIDIDPHPNFHFFDVTNNWEDELRRKLEPFPILRFFVQRFDSFTYNRLLVKSIAEKNIEEKYDLCFWMGDCAWGKIPNLPNVCWVQGAPGTDARSILRQKNEIIKLAGFKNTLKWVLLAKMRLSKLGLPPLKNADHLIVGSSEDKKTLNSLFGIEKNQISTLPCPINLDLFSVPKMTGTTASEKELNICWLGRIIPRKRLDLFLGGAELAIKRGMKLNITIVGNIGFIKGYEKMINDFQFQDRLTWIKSIPRKDIPQFLHSQNVLVQPSDEEDFGHSVAEAQSCGLPVIVGETNGNADYLSPRDIHLKCNNVESLCEAYEEMNERKVNRWFNDPRLSRQYAERYFNVEKVTIGLIDIFKKVV